MTEIKDLAKNVMVCVEKPYPTSQIKPSKDCVATGYDMHHSDKSVT